MSTKIPCFSSLCFLLAHALASTFEMPELTSLFEEAFRAEGLAATGTDAALRVEAPVSSNNVPATDRLLAHAAVGQVLSVALGAKREAVVVLVELGEGEQTLTASVALEALLVEPLAKSHDSIALIGDITEAKSANKASSPRTVLNDLHAITDVVDLVTRAKRSLHRSNRRRPRSRSPWSRSRSRSSWSRSSSPRGVTRRSGWWNIIT